MNQYENALYDAIKGILSLTGGTLGAGTGLLTAGTTSVPGAIAGSALGYGAGESIKNFAKQMQDEPIDVLSPVKVLPEGAAMEAGGQMIGKGLGYVAGKVIDKAAPVSSAVKELVESLKRTPEGKLAVEYHGSAGNPIPNPVPRSFTGLGGQSFYTTPEQFMAEGYAKLRRHTGAPSFEAAEKVPEFLNAYYQKEVPEAVVNLSTAPEIGARLGLTPAQINEAMKASEDYPYQLYAEMLRQKMLGMPTELLPESIKEVGQSAADILKAQGIQRIIKRSDLGPEVINFAPQENLFHKPTIDYALKQEQGFNDLNKQGKEAVQRMIDLLSTTTARAEKGR